jgi:hypothetical protein
MKASFWMVDSRFGDIGVELFMRLSRQEKIQYSALMAKAEIQLMTATLTDQLLSPSDYLSSTVEISQRHWISYQHSLDLARDILVGTMSTGEKYLSLGST